MNTYFECRVKYDRFNGEIGTETISENYVVVAFNHADAENCIIKEITPFNIGEISVKSVKKTKIAEIFGLETDGDKWYKAKVEFVSINDENGKEKRVAQMLLVRAEDIDHAIELVKKSLSNTVSDYEIYAVTKSPIVDVFEYEEQAETKNFFDEE
jgi:hypothetical protein